MNHRPRVLFSCRDPGGVGHFLSFFQGFRDDGRFEVEVVASGAALAMFQQSGEHPLPFAMGDGRDHLESGEDPAGLMDAAKAVLAEIQPDAVIASLSTFGVGIDEALVAICRVPSFVMQDFWGDVNLGLGVPADVYFVLDEYAAQLSHQRWGVKAVPVGSPKHTRYQSIDVDQLRSDSRSKIGVDIARPIIGFFGQTSRIAGHEASFNALAHAVANIDGNPLFLLREHTKYPDDRHTHLKLLGELGLEAMDVTGESNAETWLSACDVATTCFSSCALDHAYLSAFAREPMGTVLYLLCNPDIRASAIELCGFPKFPTVDQGLGKVAEESSSIRELLESGLTETAKADYHRASKILIQGTPGRNIVDQVAEFLGVSFELRNGPSSTLTETQSD